MAPARSPSTTFRSRRSPSRACAPASASWISTAFCSTTPSPRTSRTACRTWGAIGSSTPRRARTRTSSSARCRRGTTRVSASAAFGSPPVSASASASRGSSCRIPTCCSSTSRRARSTRNPSSTSRRCSTISAARRRSWWSRIGCRPSSARTRSWSSTKAGSSSGATTRRCWPGRARTSASSTSRSEREPRRQTMSAPASVPALEPSARDAYRRDGYYIYRGLFDKGVAEAAGRWLKQQDHAALAKSWTEQEPGVPLAVFRGVHQGAHPVAQLARDQRMLDIAGALMDAPVYIWTSKVNVKAAWCGTAEYYHQDLVYWKDRGYPKNDMLSAMILLDSHAMRNAALHVVPGSHREGRSEERRVGKECRSRWAP